MDNFRIHKLLYSEIKPTYPKLFRDIFKEDSIKQVPSYVYIGFLGERYVGIMSAYLHDINSIYLMYAGFDEEVGKNYRPILFKEVISFVHREYNNIIFRIENTNIAALKIALNTGFKIIGIRFDGILYVELLKTKEVN